MINKNKTIENEIIITKEEIDEIALIVSHAFADIYEGVYCRINNRRKAILNNCKLTKRNR